MIQIQVAFPSTKYHLVRDRARIQVQHLRVGRGRQHLLPHLLKPRTLNLCTLNIRRNLRLPRLQPLIHPKYHELNLLNMRDRRLHRSLLVFSLLLILRARVRRGGGTRG